MRTLKEIRANWREALIEFQQANLEVHKFIVISPLLPGEIPEPTSLNEMTEANEREHSALNKLKKIKDEYYEAIKAGITE